LPDRAVVAADFGAMAAAGVNTVRTYTPPPPWLLELAAEAGLRVLVGIAWEQHLAFLGERRRRRAIRQSVQAAVRASRGHPAVLGYVIGNEIPPSIVRWHGRLRVERFIEDLYRTAKTEDPQAIVTYANYPSTEFLHLPFLDVVCFNVFLEEREQMADYLARLHVLAGDRPVIVSELGACSRHHGAGQQAASLEWQLEAVFAAGCAGSFVFSWTDEWNRSGEDVDDWDFGVVDRAREPKPALAALQRAYGTAPFAGCEQGPGVSVVLCTYNGARTIGGSVDALMRLEYPNYEVIVVDDGSTDDAGEIASARGARVIQTPNRGLSAARNTGIEASHGEIIAFCDDDCRPDRDWLGYLVSTFESGDYVGVGGPNVPPPGPVVAESIGHAPGGPAHVLSSPTVAEHLPGCNMAFRRSVLDRVGGFDPQFRVAGDDVDLCWRIQDAGGTLGFSPGALVWHRSRSTIGAYLRQQRGYGHAEALLERKWPERYNGTGHLDWGEALYGGRPRRVFGRARWHVYHGRSGVSLFQSVYSGRSGASTFPLAPEWYLLLFAFSVATLLRLVGQPVLPDLPLLGIPTSFVLLGICLVAMMTQAVLWTASIILGPEMPAGRRRRLRLAIFWLCVLQPLARWYGRTRHGLTPWRHRGPGDLALPRTRFARAWSETWRSPEAWVERLAGRLSRSGAQVTDGSGFDTWDIQVRIGPLAAARVRLAVEEHGAGRQMLRVRVWPRLSVAPLAALAGLTGMAAYAFAAGALVSGSLLSAAAGGLLARTLLQAVAAVTLPIRATSALCVEEAT
jgi:GT2 family glycosyltransferase